MRNSTRSIALVVVAQAIIACDRATGPGDTVRRPATLEHYNYAGHLSAPDSARVGVPFSVEFMTYGGGCVGQTENALTQQGRVVDIHVFQREYIPRANEGCVDLLRVETNRLSVTLTVAGAGVVRVFGRRMPGASAMTLERQVIVMP